MHPSVQQTSSLAFDFFCIRQVTTSGDLPQPFLKFMWTELVSYQEKHPDGPKIDFRDKHTSAPLEE